MLWYLFVTMQSRITTLKYVIPITLLGTWVYIVALFWSQRQIPGFGLKYYDQVFLTCTRCATRGSFVQPFAIASQKSATMSSAESRRRSVTYASLTSCVSAVTTITESLRRRSEESGWSWRFRLARATTHFWFVFCVCTTRCEVLPHLSLSIPINIKA